MSKKYTPQDLYNEIRDDIKPPKNAGVWIDAVALGMLQLYVDKELRKDYEKMLQWLLAKQYIIDNVDKKLAQPRKHKTGTSKKKTKR